MATLRPQLDASQIHPDIHEKIRDAHRDLVEEVRAAVESHPVVVVGMAQNPHVKKARTLLATAEVPFEYLEYGSYFSQWRRRLALKAWTGWPTFPMVFVKGQLVGGAADLEKLIKKGEVSKEATAKSSEAA